MIQPQGQTASQPASAHGDDVAAQCDDGNCTVQAPPGSVWTNGVLLPASPVNPAMVNGYGGGGGGGGGGGSAGASGPIYILGLGAGPEVTFVGNSATSGDISSGTSFAGYDPMLLEVAQ